MTGALVTRALNTTARRFADANSTRLAAAARTGNVIATVESVTPFRLSWRGGIVPARKITSYTPVIGHTVICAYTDDNQLIALGEID